MNISCCKSYVGKQIIGLLPSQADCLFYYSPNVDVQGWTIDGFDSLNVVDINNFLNPYGYYYNFFNTSDNKENRLVLSYVGTQPPTYIPVILDADGNPVIWYLTSCCDLVCLEGTFNAADYYYFNTGLGYNINIGDTASGFDDLLYIESVLKPLYGQQTTYSYTDNGDGTFYIKIDNAYVCNLPLAWSADDVTYTDMVPCGTPPPALCAYYNQFIDNSSGCFATGSYDFEGCLTDFACLSSFYPGGYYVQDGASLPLDYCSHLTVISISTSLPAPINYLDYNGNPQTSDWTSLCDYGCFYGNIKPTSEIVKMTFCGIDIEFFSYGGNLDLYDTANAELVLFGIFKTYFPTCSGVILFVDPLNNIKITVFDVYFNTAVGSWAMYDTLNVNYGLSINLC